VKQFYLKECVYFLDSEVISSFGNPLVSTITSNTAEIVRKPDKTSATIFVAIKGTAKDGHEYVKSAFDKGAGAVVVSDATAVPKGKPYIHVKDTRIAISALSSFIYSFPSSDLTIAGVTGTNGKTTVSWMFAHALSLLGVRSASLGTLGVVIPGQNVKSKEVLTTVPPEHFHQRLEYFSKSGINKICAEVSSHALVQKRVNHVEFDAVGFTNLSRDHLDYHDSLHSYADAKFQLFTLANSSKKSSVTATVNCDDEVGQDFCERIKSSCPNLELITYGSLSKNSKIRPDLRLVSIKNIVDGSIIEVEVPVGSKVLKRSFKLQASGIHNAYNALCVMGLSKNFGVSMDDIIRVMPLLPQVPGRLECFEEDTVRVYIDYAHTPDAIGRALDALRPICQGKLWIVFGCGGDRDAGKRPLMFAQARSKADFVVVTSDNPRTEDPLKIIKDILQGGSKADFLEIDRAKAIHLAVASANPHDIILLAGKGHEDYQIIGKRKIPFSEQAIVEDALSLRKKKYVVN
jgi:UDP-N-acetylmuramoyl-L-alanyl-D-glutamate--2,6-diaminopimelate ligase